MRVATALITFVMLAGTAFAQGRSSLDAAACERLAASLKLPNTTVTSTQAVAAAADVPAYCRVTLTLKPSADSDIKSEVWLPLTGWNGKFQMVGNGGWGGSIQNAALQAGVKRGYATASTDTGHTGDNAAFALGHPEKLADFGYRSVHETTVQGKATVAAAYGSAPRLSYFTGCSGGGRQAFMEAQRFPDDFDGIIAGAPGYNRTDQSFQLVYSTKATHHDKASHIPVEKFAVLHQAALKACDAGDGLTDGLISDPLRCRFDPEVTTCRGEDGASCLTVPQVDAAKKLYAPVIDPRSGKDVFPGVEPGSEPRWRVTALGPRPLGMSEELFKYVVFKDTNWNFVDLDVAKHLDLARSADGGTISPTSTNIKPFIDRGGKMIMYHGWGDTNIPPRSSVNYYNGLIERLGAAPVASAVRLYMAPGMGHCGGGEGPNTFDMLTALEQWKEHGKAPAEVIASHATDGKVDRTRPLCPFPQIAQYKGSGSIDEAANFVCK